MAREPGPFDGLRDGHYGGDHTTDPQIFQEGLSRRQLIRRGAGAAAGLLGIGALAKLGPEFHEAVFDPERGPTDRRVELVKKLLPRDGEVQFSRQIVYIQTGADWRTVPSRETEFRGVKNEGLYLDACLVEVPIILTTKGGTRWLMSSDEGGAGAAYLELGANQKVEIVYDDRNGHMKVKPGDLKVRAGVIDNVATSEDSSFWASTRGGDVLGYRFSPEEY